MTQILLASRNDSTMLMLFMKLPLYSNSGFV